MVFSQFLFDPPTKFDRIVVITTTITYSNMCSSFLIISYAPKVCNFALPYNERSALHIRVATLTFGVTWRHRSRDRSIFRGRFPIGAPSVLTLSRPIISKGFRVQMYLSHEGQKLWRSLVHTGDKLLSLGRATFCSRRRTATICRRRWQQIVAMWERAITRRTMIIEWCTAIPYHSSLRCHKALQFHFIRLGLRYPLW